MLLGALVSVRHVSVLAFSEMDRLQQVGTKEAAGTTALKVEMRLTSDGNCAIAVGFHLRQSFSKEAITSYCLWV